MNSKDEVKVKNQMIGDYRINQEVKYKNYRVFIRAISEDKERVLIEHPTFKHSYFIEVPTTAIRG